MASQEETLCTEHEEPWRVTVTIDLLTNLNKDGKKLSELGERQLETVEAIIGEWQSYHCYVSDGHPWNVRVINAVADNHGKGSQVRARPLFGFQDISAFEAAWEECLDEAGMTEEELTAEDLHGNHALASFCVVHAGNALMGLARETAGCAVDGGSSRALAVVDRRIYDFWSHELERPLLGEGQILRLIFLVEINLDGFGLFRLDQTEVVEMILPT